ncbi:MAG: hypothetical protein COB41_08470 [Proteobacteria bacterium]|nr:MAG: hypothetical protein COB41_08470 [Pseudomonadota bacterium]
MVTELKAKSVRGVTFLELLIVISIWGVIALTINQSFFYWISVTREDMRHSGKKRTAYNAIQLFTQDIREAGQILELQPKFIRIWNADKDDDRIPDHDEITVYEWERMKTGEESAVWRRIHPQDGTRDLVDLSELVVVADQIPPYARHIVLQFTMGQGDEAIEFGTSVTLRSNKN